jgi:hypothetical protein
VASMADYADANRALRHLRDQRNLLNWIKLIWVVQSPAQKYSGSLLTQITSISTAIPAQHEGAFRDRHERKGRDAMDASCAADESALLRTAKSCGPDASMVGVKLAE